MSGLDIKEEFAKFAAEIGNLGDDDNTTEVADDGSSSSSSGPAPIPLSSPPPGWSPAMATAAATSDPQAYAKSAFDVAASSDDTPREEKISRSVVVSAAPIVKSRQELKRDMQREWDMEQLAESRKKETKEKKKKMPSTSSSSSSSSSSTGSASSSLSSSSSSSSFSAPPSAPNVVLTGAPQLTGLHPVVYEELPEMIGRHSEMMKSDARELARVKAANERHVEEEKSGKKRKYLRAAAGKVWDDPSLADWPQNDYRLFCGDLGNEVNDNTLAKVFSKYATFAKAKIIRDKRTQKTKGFGFVSFMDSNDCANALRDLQGKYVGNRPIKLRRSNWDKRDLRKQQKETRKKQKQSLV